MFHVTHRPNVVIVRGIVAGVPVLTTVDGWTISDDDAAIAFVGALESHLDAAETYAHRIAELLERHGMADVPDEVPS